MEFYSKNLSAQHFAERAVVRGLQVKSGRSGNYLVISDGKKRLSVTKSLLGCQSTFTRIFNNKGASKLYLKSLGASVLDGNLYLAAEADRALAYAEAIGFPVVIKPDNENKGRGVYVNVERENFYDFFELVSQRNGSAFVEKQCDFTDEYRLYCVKDKVVAATQRLPANVTGDGERSIEELVEAKNLERKKRGYNKYPKIKLDDEVFRVLSKSEYSLKSIPNVGKRVFLRSTSNISTGGEGIDVLGKIHSSYIKSIESVMEKTPYAFLAGFDVFIRDVLKPASKDNWYICEVNRQPAVRMHVYPWIGEPRFVGDFIMDAYFD
ncbi:MULTISPECIES: ATP-binding protein [unclassified Halomonas]|uniref:ATP-binding protein n=1 Tax=unclassified Halomonas TaxID=2609666 RepID=UPI000990435A|nr:MULTISPECIES: ATP-grasp domain-containing protein [unclassified Halomonas]AQU81883.1 hypothetical protein B2G49_04280 [Halomonas sp. 'Soap Lake \